MGKQLYRILSMTGSRTRFSDGRIDARQVMLEPVDPQPVNPWIKGSDRLPTEEDAWRDVVEVWQCDAAIYRNYSKVKKGDWWRPIDQTPPPKEPTIEALTEKVFDKLEKMQWSDARSLMRQIRAKQESEGSGVNDDSR